MKLIAVIGKYILQSVCFLWVLDLVRIRDLFNGNRWSGLSRWFTRDLHLTLFGHVVKGDLCIMKKPRRAGLSIILMEEYYACCSRSTDDPPPRFATKFT